MFKPNLNPINQFDLADKEAHHCNVLINQTHIFETGTWTQRQLGGQRGRTQFYNYELNEWVYGPKLIYHHASHVCGLLKMGGKRIIWVAGGHDTWRIVPMVKKVEYLVLEDYEESGKVL